MLKTSRGSATRSFAVFFALMSTVTTLFTAHCLPLVIQESPRYHILADMGNSALIPDDDDSLSYEPKLVASRESHESQDLPLARRRITDTEEAEDLPLEDVLELVDDTKDQDADDVNKRALRADAGSGRIAKKALVLFAHRRPKVVVRTNSDLSSSQRPLGQPLRWG